MGGIGHQQRVVAGITQNGREGNGWDWALEKSGS